jgi:uncharacterized protein (DUF111 family)
MGINIITEQCILLEANIDHRTSESLAFASDELLAAGALDVWQEQITMKKGRLGIKLCLLCPTEDKRKFQEMAIALTGTLGVRARSVERAVVARHSVTLPTPYGDVRYKVALWQEPGACGEEDWGWVRPEHDDVAEIARTRKLSYQDVYEELAAIGKEAVVS